MENSSSFGNWVLGIAGGIITGVAIWWFTNKTPSPPLGGNESGKGGGSNGSITAQVSSIEGTVINKDNNQPLPNISVDYFRFTQDANEYIHGVKSHLATTGTDGKFSADCSTIEKENFPLRLELHSVNWGSLTFQTNEYLKLNEERKDINIYVSDRINRRIH
jgi:hypothetical protein